MLKIWDRNEQCWCGSGKKYKNCHLPVEDKILQYQRKGYQVPAVSLLKTNSQIDGIRKSGAANIEILDYISEKILQGMTTGDIDRLIAEKTKMLGGVAAPLGFEGFPKSVCTSVNDQVCHGIPSDQIVLQDGDIINVDVSTILDGYYSDSSRMFCIGAVTDQRKQLVQVAKESIRVGLSEVKPWNCLGDMAEAIHTYVKAQGYTVVQDLGGHGIGLEFHEEPYVSYTAKKKTEMIMVPGMIFTIEPMINEGTDEIFIDQGDGWTIYTVDGKDSAQWEITVLITETGYDILAY